MIARPALPLRSLLVLGLVLVVVSPAVGAQLLMTMPKVEGAAGKEVEVLINAQPPKTLGCLQMALVFDPAVLEFKALSKGPLLPEGTLVEHNKDRPGRLGVALLCSPQGAEFQGEGALLKVKFKVLGDGGQKSPLVLENARAWEKNDLEVLVRTEPGELLVTSGFPWLFLVLWLLAIAVVSWLIWRGWRGKRPAPATPQPVPAAGPPVVPPPVATGSPAWLTPVQKPAGERTCPTCSRPVPAGKNFCTFDGTRVG